MSIYLDPYIDQFINNTPFEQRRKLSQKLMTEHIDRVPVFMVRADKSVPTLDTIKYLAPKDLTFGRFISEVRNKSPRLKETLGLYFLLANNVLPSQNMLMSEIYENHHSPDGFLYVKYAGENMFG